MIDFDGFYNLILSAKFARTPLKEIDMCCNTVKLPRPFYSKK